MTKHISADLFGEWMDRRRDDRSLLRQLLLHLVDFCPICEAHWREAVKRRVPGAVLLAEIQREGEASGLDAEEAIARAVQRIREHKHTILRTCLHADEAQNYQEAVLALPPEEQKAAADALPPAAATLQIARLFLEESRKQAALDPPASKHLALLAGRAANKPFEERPYRLIAFDLRAVSAALEGNGWRLAGDYPVANACIFDAFRFMDQGTGDPVVLADIQSYRASLLRDEVKLEEALSSTRNAAKNYEAAGESHRSGRVLVKRALIEYDQGNPEQAVATLHTALERLNFANEPGLEAAVYRNLALFLSEAGDPIRGLEILREHGAQADTPRRLRLHLDWTEAKIHAHLKEWDQAFPMLEQVRSEFIDLADAPNAAAITVDTALLYAAAGRLAEVQRVALEALELLLPLHLPEAVLGIFMLLKETAQKKAVGTELLRRAEAQLSQARLWRQDARL